MKKLSKSDVKDRMKHRQNEKRNPKKRRVIIRNRDYYHTFDDPASWLDPQGKVPHPKKNAVYYKDYGGQNDSKYIRLDPDNTIWGLLPINGAYFSYNFWSSHGRTDKVEEIKKIMVLDQSRITADIIRRLKILSWGDLRSAIDFREIFMLREEEDLDIRDVLHAYMVGFNSLIEQEAIEIERYVNILEISMGMRMDSRTGMLERLDAYYFIDRSPYGLNTTENPTMRVDDYHIMLDLLIANRNRLSALIFLRRAMRKYVFAKRYQDILMAMNTQDTMFVFTPLLSFYEIMERIAYLKDQGKTYSLKHEDVFKVADELRKKR